LRDVNCAGEAGHAFDMMTAAPGFEAFGEAFSGARVGVTGGADLYGGCAGEHELYGVVGSDDAAEADDGDADSAGCLVDHADRDGLDGGTGESAGDVCEARLAGFDVDGHGEEGVDEADGVCSSGGADARHGGDGGDVGRELDEQRTLGDVSDFVHQVLERTGIRTEGHAAGMHVGARDIEFVGGDAFGVVESLDNLLVVTDGVAEDVDDDFAGGIAAEGRELFLDELSDADVLKSNGIKHAGGGLDDARRGMAGHGLDGNALGDERADAFERDDLFKFDAVAESAAGGDDRVGQFNAGKLHFHVGFHARIFPSE
jgi:hypothetical protein